MSSRSVLIASIMILATTKVTGQDVIRAKTSEIIVLEVQAPITVDTVTNPVQVEPTESFLNQILSLLGPRAKQDSAPAKPPAETKATFSRRYGPALSGQWVEFRGDSLAVVKAASLASHRVAEVGSDYVRLSSLSNPDRSTFLSLAKVVIQWEGAPDAEGQEAAGDR